MLIGCLNLLAGLWELTAISDFEAKGKSDPFFAHLDGLAKKNNGLWSVEAEKYLLANAKKI